MASKGEFADCILLHVTLLILPFKVYTTTYDDFETLNSSESVVGLFILDYCRNLTLKRGGHSDHFHNTKMEDTL